jgi:hypothetical protein
MRTSLIIFGIIFLVIGGLLYFVPMQKIIANTTTTSANGNVDNRTSSADVTIPVEWAYASGVIGLFLLIFGIVIPNQKRRDSKQDSYEKIVESKENIEVGDGNKRKITRERIEKNKVRDDKD